MKQTTTITFHEPAATSRAESGADDARTPNAHAPFEGFPHDAKRLECARFIGAFGRRRAIQRSKGAARISLPGWSLALTVACFALGVAGCATRSVNPARARAHTGYVDFHADSVGELSWDVARFDDGAQSFKSVYSELKPPAGPALRLAFAPGHYRLQVTFLNRVVREPGVVEVEVRDGQITPVKVDLVPDGTVSVESKERQLASTAKGGYSRKTIVKSDESVMYRVAAKAESPLRYEVLEKTTYAR